jgi:hypothetical protein
LLCEAVTMVACRESRSCVNYDMAPDHQVERRTRGRDQRQEFHSTLEIFEEKTRMDEWSV